MSETCAKCNGTGRYQYDHNHSTVCEHCCKHDAGWWELTEFYASYKTGADNRCCSAGCGTMARDLPEHKQKGYQSKSEMRRIESLNSAKDADIKDACVCSEINARNCTVHNESERKDG